MTEEHSSYEELGRQRRGSEEYRFHGWRQVEWCPPFPCWNESPQLSTLN
jgi:hypothetical protein